MNYKTCFAFFVAVTLLAFHVNSRAMVDEKVVEKKGNFLIPLGVTGGYLGFQYVWGKTIGSKEKKSFYERVNQCEKQIEKFRKWHNKNDSVIDAIMFVYSPEKKRGSFQGSSKWENKLVQALNYLEEMRKPGGQMELAEKFVKEQSEKLAIFSNFLYDKKIPNKLREHDDHTKEICNLKNELAELKKAFKANTFSSKSKLAELRKDFGIEITKLGNDLGKLKTELKSLKKQNESSDDDESDE